MKVFLGGTHNGSTWRETLIPMLDIEYFSPVVKDWTSECQKEEKRQKEICAIHLYVITSEMSGVFSIAEAVDSAHRNPKGTILCIIRYGFDKGQLKSLQSTARLVKDTGANVTQSLEETAIKLNSATEALIDLYSIDMNFGAAIEVLKNGGMISRRGWNGKGMFVFKQIPAEIGLDIIPKMQSVPKSVKRSMLASGITLKYSNQMAIVKEDGTTDSWMPSSSDVFAIDWCHFTRSEVYLK